MIITLTVHAIFPKAEIKGRRLGGILRTVSDDDEVKIAYLNNGWLAERCAGTYNLDELLNRTYVTTGVRSKIEICMQRWVPGLLALRSIMANCGVSPNLLELGEPDKGTGMKVLHIQGEAITADQTYSLLRYSGHAFRANPWLERRIFRDMALNHGEPLTVPAAMELMYKHSALELKAKYLTMEPASDSTSQSRILFR